MSVQVEKLEKNMAKLTVEVSAEDFEKAVNTVYNRNKKSINIPGFRKGKAPRVMIEKMYGAGVFFEDAANLLINTEYPKAAQESELDIVSRPTIDIVQIEKGKSFIFTAEVAVKPEVTLGEYKGVEVEVSAADVTEEEVAAELKKGLSFPAARAAAARDYLNDPDAVSVLDSPNNILGIEYLKAIRQLQAPLIPCMVLRRGAAYHEKELTPEYSSATAIRDTLRQLQNIHAEVLFSKQHSVNNGSSVLEMSALDGQVPEAALPPFLDWLKKYGAVTPNDFSQLLHYKLLQDFSGQKDLLPQSFSMEGSCTVPSDLDNRTRKSLEQYVSFTQFTELLKTRDRTYTAVSRYLLSHLLDIDCRQHQALQDLDYAPYLHVLGMRREASPLLKALRQHSDIPILTRLATEEKNLNPSQQLLLSTDIQAAHIYNSVLTARTGQSIKNEYRHPLVYC